MSGARQTGASLMQLSEFITYHRPGLEPSEVKHNLLLGLLGGYHAEALRLWTLGAPGECAVLLPNHHIVLGALAEGQCRRLADQTRDLAFRGVVGSDDTA
jgi:hypothetical protein